MSISGQALITFFLCKNEGLELLCPCLALFCEGYQYACGLYGEGPCDGEMFRMVWIFSDMFKNIREHYGSLENIVFSSGENLKI